MSATSVVPTWMAIVVAVGTPVLTFAGVLIANWVSRRTAGETETRSKREETMRNLRWAADLSIDQDPKRAMMGLAQLKALDEADMLDAEQQVFVTAALEAVVEEPKSEIDEAEAAGEDVVVTVGASAHLVQGSTMGVGGGAVRPPAEAVPSAQEESEGDDG